MLLIPAIDLKDGRCVRLKQGDMSRVTVFSEDPAEMALHWVKKGAKRLHLVDLNGAFAGKPVNELAVRHIVRAVQGYALENGLQDVPIQLGGGIRDLDTVERYLDHGLRYIIVGTAAVKNPGFLQDACGVFAGHIIVGLDAQDGKVATDGWSKLSRHDVIELGRKYEGFGIEAIIYTDIGRDGMLQGLNIAATVRLAQAVGVPVIASGGVQSIRDVEALCAVRHEGIEGVICGRSIYEGTLDLEEAQRCVDALEGS
ncbi:MAG: 1-(5-phosphoribosyl)-5-[(5-phosphoribosylamino)methylideneamino]imidazole-4-carboxamide isomerase [Burkholderiaceae bacterium]|jgi:phosphoribosylformimino-5-aminoimidazole carboxamide ribotide isomerase|nr:1-(5-phosphoribosyl)-5-[(5-phosphoribosylamino)methylideneamino]imidazole-4-carboxamide isomerase [Burkholderiaceae bacterium]